MTGKVSPAAMERTAGKTTVPLEMGPYESRVLVFSKNARQVTGAPVSKPVGAPMDLSNGWKVTFDATGLKVDMAKLSSWSDDERTRNYSGTATYEKEVTIPASMLARGVEVKLDFGEGTALPVTQRRNGTMAYLEPPVREAAVVYVNGKRAGSAWTPPFRVDVTGLLKAGSNQIRIVVGNLAVNQMAAKPIPNYREEYGQLIEKYGDRFQPQDMNDIKVLPSGILGPLRLVATAR
jgi:hypothetical protein